MPGDKVATYSVRFHSNAKPVSDEASAALQRLKSQIDSSQSAMKEASATMRNLRGSSEEVAAAKTALQARIEAERGSITQATLALGKMGASYTKLAEAQKLAENEQKKLAEEMKRAELDEAKKRTEALEKSLAAAGGPTEELKSRFEKLHAALSTGAGKLALVAAGVAALVGAFVAVSKAIVGATVDLMHFIVESAGAARAAQLQRQAWTGTAEDATHLGHQIDALAKKVPTARDELQKLSGELVRSMSGTRAGGQAIVDTFNAVAQASAAMGDQAASKIREIIERSKQFGRVRIDPFEMQGTGLTRRNVAEELARQLHVGVSQAELALAQGRVKIGDAAAAMRAAVEKRFAGVNLEQMLNLDTLREKFRDTIGQLAKDVDLKPMLQGFQQLGRLFDTSTVSGAALKQLVTLIGNGLVKAFVAGVPVARAFFLNLVIGAQKIAIAYLKARNEIRGALGGMGKDFDVAGGAAKYFHVTIAGVVRPIVAAITITGHLIKGWVILWKELPKAIDGVRTALNPATWVKLGNAVVTGIVQGIRSGLATLRETVGNLADEVKNAFKNALGIHSPSLVFQQYGRQTTEGYRRGVDQGAAGAQRAVERAAPAPQQIAASAGNGRREAAPRGPTTVQVQVFIQAPSGQAQDLSSPSFLAHLTKALEDALVGAGLPVQLEAAP